MSSETKQPYVGVSGVASPEVQTFLEAAAIQMGMPDVNRVLALGVKAVHKTQFLDIENKYGREWYPVGEEAFNGSLDRAPHPGTIAVAQAYLDVDYVHDADYREKFMKQIVHRGQPWLQAIQFDMLPWHANNDMWGFLENVKEQGVQVFLQAHKPAMALGANEAVRLLNQHESLIDYVLFDSSHGTGTRLDTALLEPFIAEAYARFDVSQTGIAIAGGLNGEIVGNDLPSLVAVYPDLSWDAEGQLHPTDENGKRPLDLAVAADYLAASAEVLHNRRLDS